VNSRRLAQVGALVVAAASCTRESRGPASCDVAAGPCSAESSGMVVRLELAPRPLRPMQELEAVVDLSRGGAPVDGAELSLGLSMPGMYMGESRAAMRALGGGRYGARVVLVRCLSGRRDWVAEVSARLRDGSEARARFPFEAAE